MKCPLLVLLIAFAATVSAQDYGDAPASYGLAGAGVGGGGIRLGATNTSDTSNPVTPAWTGDDDDGVVGTPLWNSWSSSNQLTVHIEGSGYLFMFVDADDSGTFEQSELYTYFRNVTVAGPADLTFTGIELRKVGGYSLNGANKVAVRVMYEFGLMGLPQYQPDEMLFLGEVEDWLVDVTPPVLTVNEESLVDAEEAQSYSTVIQPINGTGPYIWALTGGLLPSGMSITQAGDNFELTGTPAVGNAGVYSLDVQITDSTSTVVTRSLSLRVLPVPYALPFKDDFSTDMHWTLEYDWAIGSATGFAGTAVSSFGYPAIEPAADYTKSNSDNKLLMSTPGAEEPDRLQIAYATTAKIDCSGLNSVQLEFRRWYSIYSIKKLNSNFQGFGEFVSIEITSDNNSWDEIWLPPTETGLSNGELYSVPIADVAWSKIQIDISQWAANKPWIRLRWRIGMSLHGAGGGSLFSNSFGNCGWAIDDVIVRETPMSNPLVAHDFEIASPGSIQNTYNNEWYPIVYPGTIHDWSVKIDNPTSEAVTIDAIEVNIRLEPPPGGANQYNPQWYVVSGVITHADITYNWGIWTLNQSVTIPANSTDTVVSGKLDFQGAPANFALVPFQAHLDLIGTHGTANTPVEVQITDDFAPSAGPMYGMYLYEVQAGTTPIDNGQGAANLRDFGSISVGSQTNWLNIVVDHTSSNTLNLGMPTIIGADAGEFILSTANYSTQISGNGITSFALIFAPQSAGQKTATVTFTHDGPNTGTPFTFEITGFGAGNGPVLKVFEGSITGQQIGNGSPASGGRDFGQVDIVAGSGQLTIAIENQGNQDLTLGTPTITGTGASEFSLNVTGMLATVAASGSTSFIIDFDPSAIGVFTAVVEFTHNDPGTATPFVINIIGEGIILAPIIEVREGTIFAPLINPGVSYDFGTVTVNTSGGSPSNIIVHNAGWMDLILGTPVLSGTNTASFSLNLGRFNATVTAGGYTLIEVNFDPLAKGAKTATLEFTHNDTNVVSPFTLYFTGIGDDPNGVIVTSDIMLEAREGNFYSDQLQATGGTGPYTWTEFSSTLNSGLTLAADGTISGTPVNGLGTFNTFVVEVTDALGGTEYGIVKIMIQPPVGFLGKNPNGGSGGCVSDATNHSALWAMLILLSTMALLCSRRRVA